MRMTELKRITAIVVAVLLCIVVITAVFRTTMPHTATGMNLRKEAQVAVQEVERESSLPLNPALPGRYGRS